MLGSRLRTTLSRPTSESATRAANSASRSLLIVAGYERSYLSVADAPNAAAIECTSSFNRRSIASCV